MGVHGLWEAISSAEKRVALVDLATIDGIKGGLRVAIDVSLWLFHVKSGREGANPGLRTFFFRLCKLLTLGIRPVFVFDGPNKPPFKRGKRTTTYGHTSELQLYVDLIKCFGFPVWHASGEAEAECAALEREGFVDAIMTDDVDVLLFGARRVIRNWKLNGGKEPSHVLTYDMTEIEANGLDKDGLLLVALMSGGDYLPSGVQNCGIKSAIELARAGWGKELVQGVKGNLSDWRDRLEDELHNNPRKALTRKRPSCIIPSTFPDAVVVKDYLYPKVNLGKVTPDFKWTDVDVNMLAIFCLEAFRWSRGTMLGRLRNSVFPAMIVQQMRAVDQITIPAPVIIKPVTKLAPNKKRVDTGSDMLTSYFKATKAAKTNSSTVGDKVVSKTSDSVQGSSLPIVNIRACRVHAKTDNQTELRVEIDLSTMMSSVVEFLGPGPSISSHLCLPDSDDIDSSSEGSSEADIDNDPSMHRIWVLESICQKAVPHLVKDFEKRQAISKAKNDKAKKKSRAVDPKGQALMSNWLKQDTKVSEDPFSAATSKSNGSEAFLQSITPKAKPHAVVNLVTPPQDDIDETHVTLVDKSKARTLTYDGYEEMQKENAPCSKALRTHVTTPPIELKSRKSPYKQTPKSAKQLPKSADSSIHNIKSPTADRGRPRLSDLEIVDISQLF